MEYKGCIHRLVNLDSGMITWSWRCTYSSYRSLPFFRMKSFEIGSFLPHLLSIELKYPGFFFWHFSICSVSFYNILCKLSCFMRIYAFKRKKKLWGNVNMFTTTSFRIYFASLTLICKLLFIRRSSLETKMLILNSQMLAFLGTLFILAIKIL